MTYLCSKPQPSSQTLLEYVVGEFYPEITACTGFRNDLIHDLFDDGEQAVLTLA